MLHFFKVQHFDVDKEFGLLSLSTLSTMHFSSSQLKLLSQSKISKRANLVNKYIVSLIRDIGITSKRSWAYGYTIFYNLSVVEG